MSRHHAPRGGGIDHDAPATPRDPRHRPVLLYVASPPRRTGHRPAPLLVRMSTSLVVVSLLTLTLVSAWRGWQVAWSDPNTPPPSASPVVPDVPGLDADSSVSPTLPAAPEASVPAGTPQAGDPRGAGRDVVEDLSAQPYVVVATMVTAAVPRGGTPARRADLVPVPSNATPTTAHTAASGAVDSAPVGTAAATTPQATTAAAAATSIAAAASVVADSSPQFTAGRSGDACPTSGPRDRPSPAAETRDRSDDEEWADDDRDWAKHEQEEADEQEWAEDDQDRAKHEQEEADEQEWAEDDARIEEPEDAEPSGG